MKSDFISLVLRICFAGPLVVFHGVSKLANISQGSANFPDPLGIGSGWSLLLAIFAEVICSALVFLGFFTRLAASVVLIQMLIITIVVHGADGVAHQELPFLYAAAFLAIVIAGGGKFSIGNALFGNKLAQL